MTKALIYHGKYDDMHLDATDEDKAFLALFSFIDKKLGYYCNITDKCPDWADELAALDGARAGSAKDAKWLLELREQYEYEGWDLVTLIDQEEQEGWINEARAPS